MRTVSLWMVCMFMVCARGAEPNEHTKPLSVLLQEAVYQEETVGDVNAAMSIYQQIIKAENARRPEIAKAYYRYGMCLLKKGDTQSAAETFQNLVANYSDQKIFVLKAQKELTKLQPDTATVTIADSFEEGAEIPTFWEQGAQVPGVEYIWDKNTACTGKASLCLKKSANKYYPIAQWTRREAYDGKSSSLQMSAMVKTAEMSKAVLDVLFLDKDDQWIKHEWTAYIGDKVSNRPITHDWKEYSGTIQIPPNTSSIVLGLQVYGPGTVWFDDLKCVFNTAQVTPEGVATSSGGGKYSRFLESPVTVEVAKSPDGDRLTVQYAVMGVCEKLGIPYQWEKSQKLAGEKCKKYIEPVKFENVSGQAALNSILKPFQLKYGLDEDGIYLCEQNYKPQTIQNKR